MSVLFQSGEATGSTSSVTSPELTLPAGRFSWIRKDWRRNSPFSEHELLECIESLGSLPAQVLLR